MTIFTNAQNDKTSTIRSLLVLCAVVATVGACGNDDSGGSADQDSGSDDITECRSDLQTCTGERSSCNTDLTTCESVEATCEENQIAYESSLSTCNTDNQAYANNQYRQTVDAMSGDWFAEMCQNFNSDKVLPDGNLGVFQDSKFGGVSRVSWSVNRICPVGTIGTGCCLELNYNFSQARTATFTAFAGVFSHFSYIPYGPIDASGFDGVGMLVRVMPEIGSTPRVSFQLADIGPNTEAEETTAPCRDGFFEALMAELGVAPETFETLNLNFTDFIRPSWYGCDFATPLETDHLYKFAIVLLNTSETENEMKGVIQLSNVHFR